jgi:uncharacterized protein YndB with AHSA1/START domain
MNLRIERTYRAPIERVFEAWTSEQVLSRWWRLERDWEHSDAEIDLRVGGALRVVMRDPATGKEIGGGGLYTEVDPPTRLAFTWLWDGHTTRTLIEIELAERDGVTTVRFTQRDLWDEQAVRDHQRDWNRMFDILADYTENRSTRP